MSQVATTSGDTVIVTESKVVINNTELVKDFRANGGQVQHIRPRLRGDRGMTVAYVVRSGRVELATSVQHRSDDFTKKVGTKIAIENFNNGRTINLPYIHRDGIQDSIKYGFRNLI